MKIILASLFLFSTALLAVVSGETESSHHRAIAVLECSEETEFDLEKGKSLLRGDLTMNSREAQVGRVDWAGSLVLMRSISVLC